jgi:hypothetical protein
MASYTYECAAGSLLCSYIEPCTECLADEQREDEQIARHVRECTADGFCYICQCL